MDLSPVRVFIAPERAIPNAVQLGDSAIPLLQPDTKGPFAIRVIAREGIARLIVKLPADDARIASVMGGQGFGNARARLQVIRAVSTIAFSPAIRIGTILVATQNVRVHLVEL